jgi:hypothetical protein
VLSPAWQKFGEEDKKNLIKKDFCRWCLLVMKCVCASSFLLIALASSSYGSDSVALSCSSNPTYWCCSWSSSSCYGCCCRYSSHVLESIFYRPSSHVSFKDLNLQRFFTRRLGLQSPQHEADMPTLSSKIWAVSGDSSDTST